MHIFTTIKFNFITLIVGMVFALLIGYAIGYFLRKLFTEYQVKEAKARRNKIIEEAEREVENRLKAAEIEAKYGTQVETTVIRALVEREREQMKTQQRLISEIGRVRQ